MSLPLYSLVSSPADRFAAKFSQSRFFTVSLAIHVAAVALLGSVIIKIESTADPANRPFQGELTAFEEDPPLLDEVTEGIADADISGPPAEFAGTAISSPPLQSLIHAASPASHSRFSGENLSNGIAGSNVRGPASVATVIQANSRSQVKPGQLKFISVDQPVRDVIFVFDVSGSMAASEAGAKTCRAVEKEMLRAIRALGNGTQFNILAFAKTVYPFRAQLAPASAGEKEAAKHWVESISPAAAFEKSMRREKIKPDWAKIESGRHMGTNAWDALKEAFDQKPDTIVFVSDGAPTGKSAEKILQDIAAWKTQGLAAPVIHCFSIGKEQKQTEFMRLLARQNGGQFKEVD